MANAEPKPEKINYLATFPDLVDIVKDDGDEKIKFLLFSGDVIDRVERGGKTFLPPPEDGILWKVPLLSSVRKEYKLHQPSDTLTHLTQNPPHPPCLYCNESLYLETVDYFTKFSEPPAPPYYDFLALMAFHSHLIEKFAFSPVLFLVAAKDRGKTPTLKALAYICRRGIFTETFREANLIRWGGDYDASIFFDVKNFPKKVEMAQCEDIIYGRAERGAKASRVLFPEKGPFRDMRNFDIFGVTAATSNHMVDEITEARCIVYRMPYSDNVYTLLPTPEYGLPLQEKLVAFRWAHFQTPFIKTEKTRPGKIENYLIGFERMVQTLFPPHLPEFFAFKEALMKEKAEEAESSFEGRLLAAVAASEPMVEAGTSFLATESVAAEMNRDRKKDYELSNDLIGRALRGMGFVLKRNAEGTRRGIFFDPVLIAKLNRQYGREEGGVVLASEASERQKDGEEAPYYAK